MEYPTSIGLGHGQTENQLLHIILNHVSEGVLYWKTIRDENGEIFGFRLSYANTKAKLLIHYNVGTKLIPSHTTDIDWDFINTLTEVVTSRAPMSSVREYTGKNGPLALYEKAWKEGDGVLLLLEIPNTAAATQASEDNEADGMGKVALEGAS